MAKNQKQQFKAAYKIKENLGKGHFAKVKRGVCTETHDYVAIKTLKVKYFEAESLSSSEDPYKILEREAKILRFVHSDPSDDEDEQDEHDDVASHDNNLSNNIISKSAPPSPQKVCHKIQTPAHASIANFISFWQLPRKCYLVTELCSGGNLTLKWNRNLKKYSENAGKKILSQVFSAVAFIHRRGIVHRDINHENILFTNGQKDDLSVKLIDFGMATRFRTRGRRHRDPDQSSEQLPILSFVGTPSFIAPEVIFCYDLDDHKGYDQKVDLWSAGVLSFYLLSGHKPFADEKQSVLYEMIKFNQVVFTNFNWYDKSEICQDFVRRLLVKEPDSRMGAEEAMCHEWLKEYRET